MLSKAEEDGEGRTKMLYVASLRVSNFSSLGPGKEALWDTRRRCFRDRTFKETVCLKFFGDSGTS